MIQPRFLRMVLKPFTWILSHTLFYIGDGLGKIMWATDDRFNLYPAHTKFMQASIVVQGWTLNKGPWKITFGRND